MRWSKDEPRRDRSDVGWEELQGALKEWNEMA